MTADQCSEQVRGLMADAYREAALKGADMRLAADCLEGIRATLLGSTDLQAGFDAINAQLVRADGTNWLSVLVPFRQLWEKQTAALRVADLQEVFRRDPGLGWGAWLRIFSVCLAGFRFTVCRLLCDAPLPFPTDGQPAIDKLRQWLSRAALGRWSEAFEMYEQLGRCPEVTPVTRARLLATAGDICTYHFWEPRVAKRFLDEAQLLASDDYVVECALGNYWLEKSEIDRAEETFRKAVTLAPERNNGLIGQGDCRQKRNDVAGAEALYEQACKCSADLADGHGALLRLSSHPSVFAARKDRIADLVERMEYLDFNVHSLQDARVNAGYAFEQNGDFPTAHQWYQRAISLAPEMVSGYRSEGYLYLAERELDLAAQSFQRLIEVAPAATAGYWGMSWLSEERKDVPAALRWCQECASRVPAWVTYVAIRQGTLQRSLGQLAEAEVTLRAVLAEDPENQEGVRALEALADDCADKQGIDAARKILDAIRAVKGDAYDVDLRARIGRLLLKQGLVSKAQDELIKALELNPANTTALESLHTISEELYRKQGNPAAALALLEQIRGIMKGQQYEQSYHNRVGHLHFWFEGYEQAAQEYELAVQAKPSDAVLHSNLGLAWEGMIPALELKAVERALRAVSKAIELAPQESGYRNRRDRLSALSQLGTQFGARAILATKEVPALVLEVATELSVNIYVSGTRTLRSDFTRDLASTVGWCASTYGVDLPPIQTRAVEMAVPGRYVLRLNDVPVAEGEVRLGLHPCTDDPAKLDALGIASEPGVNPYNGGSIRYVKEADAERATSGGVYLWTVPGHALLHFVSLIERDLGRLVRHQWVVRKLGDNARETACAQVLGSPEQTTAFVQVLRALVRERVPIGEFVPICRAFASEWGSSRRLTDIVVRLRQTDVLKPKLPGNQETSSLMTLDASFERMIETSLVTTEREPYLAIEPGIAQQVLARVREEVKVFVGSGALVVTGAATRHFVRKLIELEFPYLWAIAHDELLPGWERRVIGELAEGKEGRWIP